MKEIALGLYTYAEFGLCVGLFLPVTAASSVVHRGDATPRIPGRWMRRFGRATARLTSLWDFSIEGEAPSDMEERAYVVIANHESAADPFLLSSLPWDMRWIAKEELFRLPVVGSLLRCSGDIPLRRGDRDSVTHMMTEAKRTLRAGLSIMMFPEGTRSADGELLPFKLGAFDLAIAAGVPILPVAIAGTRACRPKGSSWFGRAKAVAKILPPLATEGLGAEDARVLAERARIMLAEALPDLRSRTTFSPSAIARPSARHTLAPSLN